MAPIATNCDTRVEMDCLRLADGQVSTKITARASHPTRLAYTYVEMVPESRKIEVETMTIESGMHQHTLPWSSAFPTEPTIGEMIEAAESLARGEWFKLFPEET